MVYRLLTLDPSEVAAITDMAQIEHIQKAKQMAYIFFILMCIGYVVPNPIIYFINLIVGLVMAVHLYKIDESILAKAPRLAELRKLALGYFITVGLNLFFVLILGGSLYSRFTNMHPSAEPSVLKRLRPMSSRK